jgi:hypothetical protein
LKSRQLCLRVREHRFVACELSLGLFELHLEGPWIDDGEQIALANELAFLESTCISWPSTRGRTVTVLNGVTDPSALMRTGTSCRDAAATPTGTFWFCGRRPDELAVVCDVRLRW